MNTEMWEHPATVHNVAVLRSRGTSSPARHRAAHRADSGAGRLPEPVEIVDLAPC